MRADHIMWQYYTALKTDRQRREVPSAFTLEADIRTLVLQDDLSSGNLNGYPSRGEKALTYLTSLSSSFQKKVSVAPDGPTLFVQLKGYSTNQTDSRNPLDSEDPQTILSLRVRVETSL